MIDNILQIVAPHYCYGCDKIGSILCDNCEYDIIFDQNMSCLVCSSLSRDGVCSSCKQDINITKAWCVSERRDILKRIIDDYKFMRVRAAYKPLAYLLHEAVAKLPQDTIVVPIPTASARIRQRGYDHCSLLAKEFARLRKLEYSPRLLVRRHNDSQRGKSKQERRRSAATAFAVKDDLMKHRPHIIIDDILTTSATVAAAAKILHDAGIRHIFAAVVARQTLDD